MLDSSILVEYAKQNKTELMDYLLGLSNMQLCINSAVLSGYTFHWLANNGRKAPRTLQQNRQIGLLLSTSSVGEPLKTYTVLPSDNRIIPIYLDLMERYNLLPNDALIIGSAKLHGIPAIASYDPDFQLACEGEGIQMIREVADIA